MPRLTREDAYAAIVGAILGLVALWAIFAPIVAPGPPQRPSAACADAQLAAEADFSRAARERLLEACGPG